MDTIRRPIVSGSGTTALEELVICDCGHAIGLHDSIGCRGVRPRSCGCARDRGWVLDAAIARSVADHRAGHG